MGQFVEFYNLDVLNVNTPPDAGHLRLFRNSAIARVAADPTAPYQVKHSDGYLEPLNGGGGGPATAQLYGDFYALMPPDNPNPIMPGDAIAFPNDGPANGITRFSTTEFILPDAGDYEIGVTVAIDDVAGEIMLRLGGVELPESVVKSSGGGNMPMIIIINNPDPTGATLEVINPSGNPNPFTLVTPAVGHEPISAHLVIKKLSV